MDVSLFCKVILLSLLAHANSEVQAPTQCEYAINGFEHKRETIAENLDKPYMLTVDYARNEIYFSQTVKDEEGDPSFEVLNIDLKTKKSYKLDLPGAFAPAIDKKTNKVFIGTDDGIFEYDPAAKTSKKIGAYKKNVWMMFYKDKLYFTTYPKEEAMYLEKNDTKPVIGVQDLATEMMVFDKNDRMYTVNCTGLFSFDKNESDSKLIGDYVVNGLTTDKDGIVYFSTPSTLNMVDIETNTVKTLFTSEHIYGIAVDLEGHILYGVEDKLFKLTPTETICAEVYKQKDN